MQLNTGIAPTYDWKLKIALVTLNHLGHLIETYITDLLVSFQLRLGLAVHIVKFRPKQPEKLGGTLSLAEAAGSILSGDFKLSFFTLKIY